MTDYKIQKIYAFRLTYTTINRSKAKMDGKNNEPRDVFLRLVWWVYKINQSELNNVINIKNPQLILSYTKPRKKTQHERQNNNVQSSETF